jgi:hypothetical protein
MEPRQKKILRLLNLLRSVPFSILLGKPWIKKDQARRKEEEVLEQKKQELKDMTRRIAHLIEE